MRNLYSQTSYGKIHALEIGNPDHDVVVFMHGFPGSHQQAAVLKEHAEALNFRVIAFDRPGYAYSDAFEKPSLKSFVLSIEEFFEDHKVKNFHIVGVSGGNPSAVSSAAHFGSRVRGLGSICGMAPIAVFPLAFTSFQRYGLGFAKNMPLNFLIPFLNFALTRFSPDDLMKRFLSTVNPSDREVLQSLAMRKVLIESMTSSRAQGSRGIVFDLKTFSTDWSNALDEIRCPYHLWHGRQDKILSYEMSVLVNERVPHSKLKLYETEGHYSLPIRRGREILTELMEER